MQTCGFTRCALVSLAGFCGQLVHAHADIVVPGTSNVVNAQLGVLNLRNGDVVADQRPDLRSDLLQPGARVAVIIDGPMTPARVAQLEGTGIRHLGYLPTNAFAADLGDTPERVRELAWVQRIIAFDSAWKLAPELSGARPAWTEPERVVLESQSRRLVSVWLFKGDSEDAVRGWAAAAGGVVRSSEVVAGGSCLSIEVPSAPIAELAALASVQWVEEFPEYGLRSNSTVRWMVQGPTAGLTPMYANGLIGSQNILGLIDGRLSVDHCSFSDPEGDPVGPLHRKILAYNTMVGYELHGTHVGGTAVGDGGSFTNSRGVAYGARLVYNYYPNTNETSVFGRFDIHASQGARVHNNSWGRTDGFNGYDGSSRAVDAFLFEHDENLIVFAVANALNISNPENSKNCLAVGAVQLAPNQNMPYSSTSTGPTIDGRRKPEVMSAGQSVLSSGGNSGCGTTSLSGTSMATPGVSGTAILVRDYFASGFYPSGARTAIDSFTPSGSLLKAMIVNSAVDVTGIPGFPSTREGWGRLIIDNSVYFVGDARTLMVRDVRNDDSRALETGGTHIFGIQAGSDDQLKVTLSWFDAPALAGTTYAPVNNLNLEVESPSGIMYLGNAFGGGVSVAAGGADAVNNLEQVLLAAPQAGMWTIRVRGSAVNDGPQGYALVVTGEVADSLCPSDFDFSGATDSDDIVGFFEAWDTGAAAADINRSGGVDSDDVVMFFESWEGGC